MTSSSHICNGRRAAVFAILLLPAAGAGCGGGRRAADAPPVTVSVAVDPAGAAPGDRVTLLWRFSPAAQWHLYWSGRNDSGFAPEIALELPPGWVAGGLQWPAPERLVSAGDILDHVYHHELVLLQQLGVPADAQVGDTARITAQVRWLACRDACVPGQDDLAFTVDVTRATAAPSPAVAAAKERLPRPLPAGLVDITWRGAVCRIAPAGPDAASLTFMPTTDCGELVDLLADGVGAPLDLRFRTREGTAGPLRGLLVVTDASGATRAYHVDAPAVETTPTNPGG